MLSSTDTVFVAGPAEFAVRTSDRPSSLTSAMASADAPGPTGQGPSAIELSPPQSPPRNTCPTPSVSAPPRSNRFIVPNRSPWGSALKRPIANPTGRKIPSANSSCSSMWNPPPPVPSSTIGSMADPEPRGEEVEMAVTVDVPRHDPPRARVGDRLGRAERPVPQPEPQEDPLRGDVELAVLVEVREHEIARGGGRERRALGRGEGVAVLEQHRHVDRAGAAFPAVAHDEVARVVVVQPPRRDHDRRVAAARDRLERLELAALVLDQDGDGVIAPVRGGDVALPVPVEVGDDDPVRVVAHADGRAGGEAAEAVAVRGRDGVGSTVRGREVGVLVAVEVTDGDRPRQRAHRDRRRRPRLEADVPRERRRRGGGRRTVPQSPATPRP